MEKDISTLIENMKNKSAEENKNLSENGATRLQTDEVTVTSTENILTGEVLKRERIKKGIDLTTVSKTLCIRAVYLEAVEKNDYNSLPEEPYTMGFVKSYADYLGLPVEKTVSAYKREMMAYIYHHLPPKELEDLGGVAVMMPKFGLLLTALLVGVVVYLIWYMVSSRFDAVETEQDTNEVQTLIVSGDIPESAAEKKQNKNDLADALLLESLEKANLNDILTSDVSKENAGEKAVKKNKKKSRISLKAVEDTWVKIAKGNETLKKGILKKGETFKVPSSDADEVILLDTGNAAGIEIYVDKRLIGKAGKVNEVKHGLILDVISLINKKGL